MSASSTAFDETAVRRLFPIFERELRPGLPLTYLDTAASAQKLRSVIDAERELYETHYANAYRGVYRFGAQIDDELEATRESVRALLNAGSTEEIAFTAGTTMSLNMIAHGWGGRHLQPGDEVVLSVMEHHAQLVPWQQAAAKTGATLRYWPLTESVELDLSRIDEVITPRTKVVAVTGMSNVTGTLNPLRILSDAVHAQGGVLVVDGAQSVPHRPTDVQRDGIDFLAFSGHKAYGPSGVGILYGRRELLAQTDPLLFGGHMISRVYQDRSEWAHLPAKFEAGTLPIAQAVALRPAIDWLRETGFDALSRHESELLRYAHERLLALPGLRIFGPDVDRKGGIISFTLAGAHPEDLAQLLDRRGVFVRHGHHCTMPLHDWLGVPATVRASLGAYSHREDVDRLCAGLEFAREKLRLV